MTEGEQEELGDAGRWCRAFRPQGAVWVLSLGRQAAVAVSSRGEGRSDLNFEVVVGEAGGMFGVDLDTVGGGGVSYAGVPVSTGEKAGPSCALGGEKWTDVRSALKLGWQELLMV